MICRREKERGTEKWIDERIQEGLGEEGRKNCRRKERGEEEKWGEGVKKRGSKGARKGLPGVEPGRHGKPLPVPGAGVLSVAGTPVARARLGRTEGGL